MHHHGGYNPLREVYPLCEVFFSDFMAGPLRHDMADGNLLATVVP